MASAGICGGFQMILIVNLFRTYAPYRSQLSGITKVSSSDNHSGNATVRKHTTWLVYVSFPEHCTIGSKCQCISIVLTKRTSPVPEVRSSSESQWLEFIQQLPQRHSTIALGTRRAKCNCLSISTCSFFYVYNVCSRPLNPGRSKYLDHGRVIVANIYSRNYFRDTVPLNWACIGPNVIAFQTEHEHFSRWIKFVQDH